MACDLYVGKVTDEPDTWVLGTIKRVNTKYAVIQQRCEYPFAKCCGVGDFEVYTDSLIKVPIDEWEEENTKLKERERCKMNKEEDKMFDKVFQTFDMIEQNARLVQSKVETMKNLYDEQTKLVEMLCGKVSYLYRALELACIELGNAKEMLYSVDDEEEVINDDMGYYIEKAKEDMKKYDDNRNEV